MARTNAVSEVQATRPEESAREREARGKIRTTQDQIRLPSARKKYVANRMMKKPATMWPTAVPTSVSLADDLGVGGRDRVLRGR